MDLLCVSCDDNTEQFISEPYSTHRVMRPANRTRVWWELFYWDNIHGAKIHNTHSVGFYVLMYLLLRILQCCWLCS